MDLLSFEPPTDHFWLLRLDHQQSLPQLKSQIASASLSKICLLLLIVSARLKEFTEFATS